jgi:hypothetical protein
MQLARAACRGARPRLSRRAALTAAPTCRPFAAVASTAAAAAAQPTPLPLRRGRGMVCAAAGGVSAAADDDDAPEPYFWRGGDTLKVPMTLHADNRARLREAICTALEARGIEPGIVILQARLSRVTLAACVLRVCAPLYPLSAC